MNQDTIKLINSTVVQDQVNLAAHTEMQTLAIDGWQTDQQTIADGIAAGLATANARITALSQWIVDNGGDLDKI